MSNSNGRDREATIAKTAGFIVFSGIGISILKSLNPFKKNNTPIYENPSTSSFNGIPQPPPSPCLQPRVEQQLIVVKKQDVCKEQREQKEASDRFAEIENGDTLWGLSQKYGISIDAIKEANGLTGDTIYAEKNP